MTMQNLDIAMPTTRGLKNAAIDYLYGGAGAVVAKISTRYMGDSLLGNAVAAALAGSVVKGEKGEILAVMIGFNAVMQSGLVDEYMEKLPAPPEGGLLGKFGINI